MEIEYFSPNKAAQTAATEKKVGWPPLNPSEVISQFICPYCHNVLFNPHQMDDCGCQFCLRCLEELFEKKCDSCPVCESKIVSQNRIPDKYLQRKLNVMKVKCTYQNCDFQGNLVDYKSHYATHNIITCEYCRKDFSETELCRHLDAESGWCPLQPMQCPYAEIGCYQQLNNNREDNSSAKRLKTEIDSMSLGIGSLSSSTMDSAVTTEASDGVMTREKLAEHLDKNLRVHLELFRKFTMQKISEIQSKFKLTTSADINFGSIGSATSIDSGFSDAASSIVVSNSSMDFNSNASSLKLAANSKMIFESSGVFEGIKNEMITSMQKMFSNDLLKTIKLISTLRIENERQKEMIKEQKAAILDLQKILGTAQVSMLALEERLINQEKVSYTGELLWKITNVHERIQEAKQGRQTSFYSPPFYTSRNGFKMCARIYLNGDGNGRNTHLSLFFVLLRGENDSLLRWPFRQKVSFTLIDQTTSESKEHVIDAFRPDPNSSSFRRPISEMNIASGLPLFCPLAKLMSNDHEYIKENTMFIKIKVDVRELPDI